MPQWVCKSINPGATIIPEQSMTRPADVASSLPTATIFPLRIATSATVASPPLPSRTEPPRSSTSVLISGSPPSTTGTRSTTTATASTQTLGSTGNENFFMDSPEKEVAEFEPYLGIYEIQCIDHRRPAP